MMTRAEYQDLIDSRDHATAMRDIATGAMETLSSAEADAYLAARVGIAQPSLAQAETGRRGLSAGVWSRLAKALRTRIEDLLPDPD